MDEQPGSRWFDRSWVMWAVLAVLAVVSSATAIGVTRWVTADRSVVAGPSSSVAPSESPSSSVPSPSPSPSLTDEQQIVAQYARLQPAIYEARLGPTGRRRAILEPLVAEPYLATILSNMEQQEEEGFTLWGEAGEVLSVNAEVTGSSAALTACLDESRGGQARIDTGEKVTVGLQNNPARATYVRAQSGSWLVVGEEFPGGPC